MNKAILFFICLLPYVCKANVDTWQGPKGFSSNKYYEVKVNGVNIPVYNTPIASYAIFDFDGEAKVDVQTMYDVRWVDIRPTRLHREPVYTGDHSFSFIMETPEHISLELNGRIRQQPLFIFANKLEDVKPDIQDKKVIWFKGGKLYKDVELYLEDNQTVYIEGGAVVQGFIYAEGKKNIKICGRGILDGSFVKNNAHNKNGLIKFKDCSNVTIEDIVLHNATTWQVVSWHSKDVFIKNIHIVSESGGDDGIDLVRSKNVVIDHVFAHTKDDCVAIKSHGDYPNNDSTDNILVKNSTFWNSIWGNALEIGFELQSDEVKNIRFENCDLIHVEDGAAMSIHNSDRAIVENVTFENIRVEDSRQKLFDVAIFYSYWCQDGITDPEYSKENYVWGAWDSVIKVPKGKEEYHNQFRGHIDGVVFKNIQVVGGLMPFSIFAGYDANHIVKNILLDHISYMGQSFKTEKDLKISKKLAENIIIK